MNGISLDRDTCKAVFNRMVNKIFDLDSNLDEDLQNLDINGKTVKTLETLCRDKINKALQSLATDIIPTEEYMKAGTAFAEKILDLIKQKSKFKFGRECHAGSSGKKTTIIFSDFDCVLFVNDEEPIFEEVLDDLEDILIVNTAIINNNIRKTKYSLQFQFKGFGYDFLPAPNFVKQSQLSGDALTDRQQKVTLDKMKQNPNKYRYAYSPALSEAQVRFMKSQDGFVNEMVRIAKFWFSTLHFQEYISGAKSLVEIIMVDTVNNQPYRKKNYLECFSKFLQRIEKFDDLHIVFENEYRFPEHKVPDYIRQQKPLVLEPANPYNNLAKYWTKNEQALHAKNRFQGYAAETIRRLKITIEVLALSGGKDVIPMEHVLESQPKVAPIKIYFKTGKFYCGVYTENINVRDCKIRNENLMKVPEFVSELEHLRNYIYLMIKCYESSRKHETVSLVEVQNKVCEFIDVSIRGATHTPWPKKVNDHKNYDLTLTIPLQCGSIACCFKISWKQ